MTQRQSDSDMVPQTLVAVAMEAESGCSRCDRQILLLEKAFLDEQYAAVCVTCAAAAFNTVRYDHAMKMAINRLRFGQ